MDLALNLPLTPNIAESIKHRMLVTSDAGDKTAQFGHSAVKRPFDPGLSSLGIPGSDELSEGLSQQAGDGHFWMCLQNAISLASLLF